MVTSPSPKARPRIYIADPVCVLDHGHNPQSLLYFSDYFAARGYDSIPVACRRFRLTNGPYKAFRRAFSYYYQRYMPVTWDETGEEAADQRRIQQMLTLLAASPSITMSDDFLELTALSDWLDFYLKEGISERDTVFLPSADYYGICGILRLLFGLVGPAKPRVHLRFIGVMETTTHGAPRPLNHIRALLRRLDNADGRLTLSAESPAYARWLSSFFGQPVATTLYPLETKLMPLSEAKPFVVYSAGAGREDKGFMRMLNISQLYMQQHPDHDVLFRIQNLRPDDEKLRAAYCTQLYAQPNVDLIDASQSDKRMQELFREASFLILPYEQKIYRMRGSAIVMEGVSYGRPLAITANTGFHEMVEDFETMFNAATDAEFCDAIARIYEAPASDVMAAAARDAKRYQDMSSSAFAQFFGPGAPQPADRRLNMATA